ASQLPSKTNESAARRIPLYETRVRHWTCTSNPIAILNRQGYGEELMSRRLMFRRFIKRLSSVPPHVAIILVLVGIVGVSGAVLLFRHAEPKTEAHVIPRAARLERVDGNVDIAQALNHADNDQLAWQDALVNAPLT